MQMQDLRLRQCILKGRLLGYPYVKTPQFILNAMQVNVDYSALDITRECVIFHGYGNFTTTFNIKTLVFKRIYSN